MPQETGLLELLKSSFINTLVDISPILLVLLFFQVFIIRKKIPHLKQIVFGLCLVVIGLAIFIVGLEECIFPIGTSMAEQLTDPIFLAGGKEETTNSFLSSVSVDPTLYIWTYIFAFTIGFSTTLAEPALIAVSIKAREISTGAVSQWGLRIAVAFGVGFGVTLGAFRIVSGTPLHLYMAFGYLFLIFQTIFAPKTIIPLAYDTGGVTTSTVTVPVLAALGIGLASNVSGRSPIMDGFGLIAFASLFPIIAVLAYAMIGKWLDTRRQRP
jgi:hypothetical protein